MALQRGQTGILPALKLKVHPQSPNSLALVERHLTWHRLVATLLKGVSVRSCPRLVGSLPVLHLFGCELRVGRAHRRLCPSVQISASPSHLRGRVVQTRKLRVTHG